MTGLKMTHVWPDCGHQADCVGSSGDIDYIQCAACGHLGDRWQEDGVIHYTVRPASSPQPPENAERREQRIAALAEEMFRLVDERAKDYELA